MKLQPRDKHPTRMLSEVLPAKHILCQPNLRDVSRNRPKATEEQSNAPAPSPIHAAAIAEADTWFASHDTWGILDTGATKTVMGSNHVKGFLNALSPEVKKQIQRTSCDIMFRFGNQGTLQAVHALVVPLAGMKLKIAVVEGATPFLVSNTLLRALGAMIDTSQNQLVLPKHHVSIPLKLSAKGLYLIDTNELFKVAPNPRGQTDAAETFAQDDLAPAKMPEDPSPRVAAKNVKKRLEVSGKDQRHEHDNTPCSKIDTSCDKAGHAVTFKDNEFWPISSCRREHPVRTSKNHGGLAAATEPCPSSDACSRRGISESPDVGAVESHSDVVWQGSCGKEPRDNLDGSSRLDQVVFQPLQVEPQDRAQEDDTVHPAAHRGGGKSRPTSLIGPSGNSQTQEHAEVICSQGKVPAGTSQSLADCRRIGDGRASDGASMDHSRNDRSTRRSPSHSQPSSRSRECHATGDCSDLRAGTELQRESRTCPSRNCSDRLARPMGTVEDHETHCDWSLQAGEIDQFCETIPNKEKEHFWNLVNRMEKEIDQLSKIVKPLGKQADLLEVFCSEKSALSDQVLKLGGTAYRFGRAQGDLETTEGRKALFVQLLKHRPKNVWMSPTCGPWSKWSQFNLLRSLSAFDSIQQQRFSMLIQVALCLVLCRYQHRQCRHAHWEQPKGSYMMRLPYIQEIYRYMLCAMPDLCDAGNLRDPVSNLLMQKGLHIMTTSQKLHESLHHLKCTRDHVHQPIEGSTQVHGRNVARSELSEIYPRKFGRLVAKTLLKVRFPMEKPVGSIADTALSIFDVFAAEAHAATVKERPPKRCKTVPRQGVKTPAAAGASDQNGDAKRPRTERLTDINPKSNTNSHKPASEQIQMIVRQIEGELPRVGKRVINNPKIIQDMAKEFPEITIKAILACKRTNRRMGPPSNVHAREAPLRRSIMKIRDSNDIVLDDEWENYENLSHRKIIRSSPPCRVNITMFAANPNDLPPDQQDNAGARSQPSVHVPETTGVPIMEDQNVTPEIDSVSKQSEETPQERLEVVEKTVQSTLEEQPAVSDPNTGYEQPDVHGARFRALPREEQAMLRRAHKNLCHPSAEQLSATLRNQGCRPEIHQAVFDMKCPTCAASQKPKLSRPSSLKPELDFNDKVLMDGIKWTSKQGQSFHFHHFLDQATNFHVAIPAQNRTAEQAIQKTTEAWLQWAGPPNMLVTDPATEFTSEMFQDFLQRNDIKGIKTSPNAHWQNGRCERHGEILQSMLTKIDLEQPITTYWEFHQALVQSTHAKNTLSIRRGYSPEILVFGESSKIPGSITSSDDMTAHESANRDDAQGILFRRNLALREKARVAFHQADNDQACAGHASEDPDRIDSHTKLVNGSCYGNPKRQVLGIGLVQPKLYRLKTSCRSGPPWEASCIEEP